MCLALALASLTVPRGLQRFKHHMADLRHWLQKKKEIQPSSASCLDHLHRWRVLAYERKSFHVNVRKSAYSMPGVRHDPADSLLWSMSELSLTRRAQGEKPSRSPSLPVQMESNRDPSLYSTASVSRASEPTRFSDIMLLPRDPRVPHPFSRISSYHRLVHRARREAHRCRIFGSHHLSLHHCVSHRIHLIYLCRLFPCMRRATVHLMCCLNVC